jgi:hypothetical protein
MTNNRTIHFAFGLLVTVCSLAFLAPMAAVGVLATGVV